MPSEREFGELRSDVKGVADAVKELRRVNSEEHAANAARLQRMEDRLGSAIDAKASEEWVREHETRLRSIEDQHSEDAGKSRAAGIAKGAFIALTPFAIVVLTEAVK